MFAFLGWQPGSLLFTTTPEQNEGLQRHVAKLEGAGVHATLLSAQEAQGEEPALRLPPGCTAALVPEDAQIDAILVVEALLQVQSQSQKLACWHRTACRGRVLLGPPASPSAC